MVASGWTVLRFTNAQVLNDLAGCVAAIASAEAVSSPDGLSYREDIPMENAERYLEAAMKQVNTALAAARGETP